MKRLVLHIGSAKCGSSSIQAFLGDNFTQTPARTNTTGESVAYAAVAGDHVLLGDELRAQQQSSPLGYVASAGLDRQTPAALSRAMRLLQARTRDTDIVVLSCEGWNVQAARDSAVALFSTGVPVDIVLVVRPPVEMMNAAWWQWGAWSGAPLAQWCRERTYLVDYMSSLDAWKRLGPVDREHVIELSEDPIRQVARFLGFSMGAFPPPRVLNQATNARLLLHLVRNRAHYGREVHEPRIEFELNSILNLSHDQPPFVIPPAVAKELLDSTQAGSARLLEHIRQRGGDLAEEVVRRYRDPNHYADVAAIDFETLLAAENPDDFVRQLIGTIQAQHGALQDATDRLQRMQRELDDARRQIAARPDGRYGRLGRLLFGRGGQPRKD